MYKIYLIRNKVNGNLYVGQTKNTLKTRYAGHKHEAKKGNMSPLYCAMRKYGLENFDIVEIGHTDNRKDCDQMERDTIKRAALEGIKTYNILLGGEGGNIAKPENRADWVRKLKSARQGRKPALGMKHTDENKKFFREVSREYWDNQETYTPKDVLKHRFCDANRIFGISKTHYYRLVNLHGRTLTEEDEILANRHRMKVSSGVCEII